MKALIALVGRLSLSVGWDNVSERGLKTVSFNPQRPVIQANSADPDKISRSAV